MRRWVAGGALVLGALLLTGITGCCCHGTADEPKPVNAGPLPAYADVARAYNARVNGLEKLGSSVAVVVKARDAKNEKIDEQIDANLQVALPDKVYLRLNKITETIFILGSNETHFWWFDLTKDRVGAVGTHAKATPQGVTSFGVPVHPLDLIEVLGIKPLPAPDSKEASDAKLAWSADGRRLGLTLPGRWGERRFWLDPRTYDPAGVDLIDAGGVVLVSCAMQLDRYIQVPVDGDTTIHPRVSQFFTIELPAQQARISLQMYEPKNPRESMKMRMFDLTEMLKYYRIDKLIDVDAPPKPLPDGKAN